MNINKTNNFSFFEESLEVPEIIYHVVNNLEAKDLMAVRANRFLKEFVDFYFKKQLLHGPLQQYTMFWDPSKRPPVTYLSILRLKKLQPSIFLPTPKYFSARPILFRLYERVSYHPKHHGIVFKEYSEKLKCLHHKIFYFNRENLKAKSKSRPETLNINVSNLDQFQIKEFSPLSLKNGKAYFGKERTLLTVDFRNSEHPLKFDTIPDELPETQHLLKIRQIASDQHIVFLKDSNKENQLIAYHLESKKTEVIEQTSPISKTFFSRNHLILQLSGNSQATELKNSESIDYAFYSMTDLSKGGSFKMPANFKLLKAKNSFILFLHEDPQLKEKRYTKEILLKSLNYETSVVTDFHAKTFYSIWRELDTPQIKLKDSVATMIWKTQDEINFFIYGYLPQANKGNFFTRNIPPTSATGKLMIEMDEKQMVTLDIAAQDGFNKNGFYKDIFRFKDFA